jgi:hypothetical protein
MIDMTMQKKTGATETAETSTGARKPDPKRDELSPADQRELDAFEVVSRRSRRAVAETIDRLVRPA